MSVMDREQLREELVRLREARVGHRRRLEGQAAPLGDPGAGPRAGAYADDDPELHRRFAEGELDEELIDSFIND